jgi:hypothetical protein
MLDTITLRCPWCGERFETVVDSSAGSAEYTEDCPVCCRPIVLRTDASGGDLHGFASERED